MAGKRVREVEHEEKGKETASTTSSPSTTSSSSDEREYEMQDLRDRLKSSRGSRFDLIENQLELTSNRRNFSRLAVLHGFRGFSKDFFIHPDSRFHHPDLFFPLVFSL